MAGLTMKITESGIGHDGLPGKLDVMFTMSSKPPATAFVRFAGDMKEEVEETFQVEGQIKPGWKKSGRAERSDGQTLQRKGRLKKSISFRPGPESLEIGTNDKRARLLFLGGVVKPKHAKYLAIPVDDTINRPPRSYPNTFIGNGMFLSLGKRKSTLTNTEGGTIYQAQGKGRPPKPLFYLRKSVKMPPRRFIEITPSAIKKLRNRLCEYYLGTNDQ